MAKYVIDDAYFTYNGVDLSSYVKSITIASTFKELQSSAMGDSWEEFTGGLGSWTMSVEFIQDHGSSTVDDTLWAAHTGRAANAVVVRPDSAAVASTNPQWTGNALVPSYSPIDGAHGALATTSTNFRGSGALTRATS